MTKSVKLVIVAALALAGIGCGDLDNGRSPSRVIVSALEAAPGADPSAFSGTLQSDVLTDGGVLNDLGRVTMSMTLRDPGVPGLSAAPTELNQVTFSRYRVEYRRTDGRNTPGQDVPYDFDSAATFTVPHDGSASVNFQLVRHSAKEESPLRALRNLTTVPAVTGELISTIATVTFYGTDQAGNAVSVKGSIGIDFGDFADPD